MGGAGANKGTRGQRGPRGPQGLPGAGGYAPEHWIGTGDDSTTVFTLPASVADGWQKQTFAFVNGMKWVWKASAPSGREYSVSGDQITFGEAPELNAPIEVHFCKAS